MIRNNWKTLLITSILTVLPLFAGLLLWNQLPDELPIHWNAAGEVDGWGSKAFAVFFFPLLMLAIQWICVLGTGADPKKQNHSEKVIQLVLWIVPVLSIVLHTFVYLAALGNDVPIERVLPILIGLVFVIIGNYLPKCKQNYTVGIKLPWTLHSEENWNKTHRLSGMLWVVCGFAIMLTGFFGGVWVLLPVMTVMVLVPFAYSYLLYRKGI